MGREFKTPSILVSIVENSSKFNFCAPAIRFKWNLKLLTATSHSPPMWGACGGMNFHVKPWVAYFWDMSCKTVFMNEVNSRNSTRLAPRKFLPLSDITLWGSPRLPTKRENAAWNAAEKRSEQASKWTAFVLKQKKTQAYTLMVWDFRSDDIFRSKGPAKSIPI